MGAEPSGASPPALSVNINKVATLRNSRGGTVPSVLEAVDVCVDAGCHGITVHPRADGRHITEADTRAVAERIHALPRRVEFNVEGDPRPALLALVREVQPDQCTLVPVQPGEITSQAGWPVDSSSTHLRETLDEFRGLGIRSSLFVDAEPSSVRWAAELGADRIELYTEPFARAFKRGPDSAHVAFERCAEAAELAHSLGLGINAGHDLDVDNLSLFRTLPHLAEVSIGHALISLALFVGLATSIQEFLEALGHQARRAR